MPTIGIFDSGVGGLTVLRALRAQYPHADFVYLGDTARVPYGNKSPETISRYAHNAAQYLLDRGCGAIVIACNTASAFAADSLRERLQVPVIDVIAPLATHIAQRQHQRVLILGTHGTVQSKAYPKAIQAQAPQVQVAQQACSLFVPLVEEGWTDGPIVDAIIDRYLEAPLQEHTPDLIVLGCTHYPILRDAIAARARAFLPDTKLELIDSGQPTAAVLGRQLQLQPGTQQPQGTCQFLVTDAPDRFRTLAARFLLEDVAHAEHVELPTGP